MNVQIRILFRPPPTEEDWKSLRTLANRLTKKPESVRVFADTAPAWLVVEFAMPRQTQNEAVQKIDQSLRFHTVNHDETIISFPLTEAERSRVRRKTARRKARREARKSDGD